MYDAIEFISRTVPGRVFRLVGSFHVSGITTAEPETPMGLDALAAAFRAGKYICASVGCEQTVWPHGINYTMRAWHDWHHAAAGLGFSFEEEANVARAQFRDLISPRRLIAPKLRRGVARLLAIEIIGQARYYRKHGRFVCDQREFARLAWSDDDGHFGTDADTAFILGEGELV